MLTDCSPVQKDPGGSFGRLPGPYHRRDPSSTRHNGRDSYRTSTSMTARVRPVKKCTCGSDTPWRPRSPVGPRSRSRRESPHRLFRSRPEGGALVGTIYCLYRRQSSVPSPILCVPPPTLERTLSPSTGFGWCPLPFGRPPSSTASFSGPVTSRHPPPRPLPPGRFDQGPTPGGRGVHGHSLSWDRRGIPTNSFNLCVGATGEWGLSLKAPRSALKEMGRY